MNGPKGAALDRTHPPSLKQLSGERQPTATPKHERRIVMIKDIMSFAETLYIGGWRPEDEEELMEEHQLSRAEARQICEALQEYEDRIFNKYASHYG